MQQEVPGTVQDFKAVVDATGQSVESKKMRGWRVALAKQAGVSVDDLRIVKTANQPRAQRGGGRSTVVLTYEFSVKASEPCVSCTVMRNWSFDQFSESIVCSVSAS